MAKPVASPATSPMWLTRAGDLEMVRREGKRFRTSLFEVRALASLLASPRVGLIVPRHHHTAVRRNRLKRQLRAAVRGAWTRLAAGAPQDIVVRTVPAAYDAPFAAIVADVERASERLGQRLRARPDAPATA